MALAPPSQSPEERSLSTQASLERRIANLENQAPHAIVVPGRDPRGGQTEWAPQIGTLVITTESYDYDASVWTVRPTLWFYAPDSSGALGWWRHRSRSEEDSAYAFYEHGA